jgi:hypothetical protein
MCQALDTVHLCYSQARQPTVVISHHFDYRHLAPRKCNRCGIARPQVEVFGVTHRLGEAGLAQLQGIRWLAGYRPMVRQTPARGLNNVRLSQTRQSRIGLAPKNKSLAELVRGEK